jgi:hypothetical protein
MKKLDLIKFKRFGNVGIDEYFLSDVEYEVLLGLYLSLGMENHNLSYRFRVVRSDVSLLENIFIFFSDGFWLPIKKTSKSGCFVMNSRWSVDFSYFEDLFRVFPDIILSELTIRIWVSLAGVVKDGFIRLDLDYELRDCQMIYRSFSRFGWGLFKDDRYFLRLDSKEFDFV